LRLASEPPHARQRPPARPPARPQGSFALALTRGVQSLLLIAAGSGLTSCSSPVPSEFRTTNHWANTEASGTIEFMATGSSYDIAVAGTPEANQSGVLVIADSTMTMLGHTRLAGLTATGSDRTETFSMQDSSGVTLAITFKIDGDGRLKGIEHRRGGALFAVNTFANTTPAGTTPGEYAFGDTLALMRVHVAVPDSSPELSLHQVAGPFACAASILSYVSAVVAYFGALSAWKMSPNSATTFAVLATGAAVMSAALWIADNC